MLKRLIKSDWPTVIKGKYFPTAYNIHLLALYINANPAFRSRNRVTMSKHVF